MNIRAAALLAMLHASVVSAQPAEIRQILEPIPDRLTSPDSFGFIYGSDIAVENDVLVVSDPHEYAPLFPQHGRVYVYTRDAGGDWSEHQVLTISDPDAPDFFGRHIELSNGRLVATTGSWSTPTSVLTFAPDENNEWREIPGTALDIDISFSAYPEQGPLVLSGNTLVVAEAQENNSREILIFDWDDDLGWVPAPNPEIPDLERDTVVIKAFENNTLWMHSSETRTSSGFCSQRHSFVFDREPDGSWIKRAQFDASIEVYYSDRECLWLHHSLIHNDQVFASYLPAGDGPFTHAFVPVDYEADKWTTGDQLVMPPNDATLARPSLRSESAFLRHASTGDRFFVPATQGTNRYLPTEIGILGFANNPDHGIAPLRFRSIPLDFGVFRSIQATDDQLFVSYTATDTVWLFGSEREVARPRVLILDLDQFSDPCPGDFALPVDILDLNDLSSFIRDFSFEFGTRADLAPPFGVYDAADITAFVQVFLAGCD